MIQSTSHRQNILPPAIGSSTLATVENEPDVFSEQEMHILEVVKDKYA